MEDDKKSICVKSIHSSFKFAPFWSKWETEGTFDSIGEARETVLKSCVDELGRHKYNIIRKTTRKNDSLCMVLELLPHWGADETLPVRRYDGTISQQNAWGLYNSGKLSKHYLHLRFNRN